jgi:2-keto-3-deoxy-L-rhamnonate aldolase RhmA
MRTNRLKQRLAAGAPMVGTLLSFNSPELVEFCGLAGFDFVLIDGEHNLVGSETCLQLVRAAEAADVTSLVRVPRNDPSTMLGFLETGVQGVMVPHVRTAEDARAAVNAVKYSPAGTRSAASSSRAANYGLTQGAAEYFREANAQTMVIPLIEEVAAFHNLEAIGQTPGVDLLFMGTADLAMDMGYVGQRDHPAVRAVVDDAIGRAKKVGIALGAPAATGADAARLLAAGVQFVQCPTTALFGEAARSFLAQARGG